jgi:hypothetical protein
VLRKDICDIGNLQPLLDRLYLELDERIFLPRRREVRIYDVERDSLERRILALIKSRQK